VKAPLQFDSLDAVRLPDRPLHLAVGMFDGVHLGHQSVISAAVQSARRADGLAGVLTFWPHPSSVLRPAQPTRLLMPPAMKRRVLARLGVDFIVEQPFTPAYAAIPAEGFMPHLLERLPRLAAVYVGENWRFGTGRAGDVALLVAEAAKRGVTVYSAPRLNHNGAPISSSRIRALLADGAIEEVNALLGYTYFAEGEVESGRQLGRTIGFPTLNISWEPEVPPRYGVYSVALNGLWGVANYGVRPTVGAVPHPVFEVHLLDQTSLVYGDRVLVEWHRFIRPERKFSGVEELKEQIARDREIVAEYARKRAEP
jgi:riboflavin kinase/FMN adenylyltransferase